MDEIDPGHGIGGVVGHGDPRARAAGDVDRQIDHVLGWVQIRRERTTVPGASTTHP